MQITIYQPYPHFRPRLKLQSMQRAADGDAASVSADALLQSETSVETQALSKLQHAHQCLGYLVCQTLYAMELLRPNS